MQTTLEVQTRSHLWDPLSVRLIEGELVYGPCLDAGELPIASLVLEHELLDRDLLQDLLERMAGALRPRLPMVTPRGDRIRVPLIRPEPIGDYASRWRIADVLAVEHAYLQDMYFVLPEGMRPGSEARFDLAPHDVWALLRALASLEAWQQSLEVDYAVAATARRRALIAAQD